MLFNNFTLYQCDLKKSFFILVNCGLKPSNLIQPIKNFHLTNKAKIQNSKIEICPSSLSSTTMTNSTMPVLSTTLPYTCFTPLSTISSSLNQRKMSLYTNTLTNNSLTHFSNISPPQSYNVWYDHVSDLYIPFMPMLNVYILFK